MRSLFLAAISAASLSSQASALEGRYEAARRLTLEIGVNSKAFANRKVEVLCFAESVTIKSATCQVLNEYDEASGSVLVWLDDLKPADGADLVNECRKGIMPGGIVRPSCRLYVSGRTDGDGNIFAERYEQVENRD